MKLILQDEYYDLFEASIQVKEKHFKYYFELYRGNNKIAYTADGIMENPNQDNYFYYPVINPDDVIILPKWAEGEIIYQVLIDRFYDGCKENNPANIKDANVLPDRNTYYGGDFQGMIEKLDYIKSLGTKIIYMSPVFESPNYHKYDIKDYYKIEEIYGGEEGLKTLVEAAHNKDMKVVLDCVYNHCSNENEIFKDVVKNEERSKYKDWFYIEGFPIDEVNGNYDNFGALVPSMPRFNTSNKEVIDYLVDTACYWTEKLDIDGWRLDVCDEVSTSLWREFRRRLKAIKSDILIIGEVWNHATKWTLGDQVDTVTNYKYRKWLLDFLKEKITSREFWHHIQTNKMLYKTPLSNYLVNLVGSHDTIRLKTFIKNENLHFLSLALTLMFDGMPLIYYGDEIGLEGDVDPDNRRAFRWEDTSKKELAMIKQLGSLRNKFQALKKGKIKPIFTDDRVIAFTRKYQDEEITVVINFSESEKILQIAGTDILYGQAKLHNQEILIDSLSIIIIK
jgi:glycosidase